MQKSISDKVQNRYLDCLINPVLQVVNIFFFFLSFENKVVQESCKCYASQTAQIKDYNVMIDGRNFLINH